MTERFKNYTFGEEIFNSVSHGVGSLLAVVGGTVMITLSAVFGTWIDVLSASVYTFSLIILYTMSTLYHAIPFPKAKGVMQILDHSSIFLLIAGTYTPLLLVLMRDSSRGLIIFAAVWALAVLGIALNAVNMHRFRRISMVLYLLMGWAVLFDFRSMIERLERPGFALLLWGGVSYTAGIIFYKLKKVRYMHGVWHLFVLGGSVLHYLCLLMYVLPHPQG